MASRDPRNIFLTGFSTTGKTTVSALVAKRLGFGLADTDLEAERLAGRPVPGIFRDDGEERFRDLESAALQKVAQGSFQVIATGGGAVLRPENRQIMLQHGIIVCLEAKPETILSRLAAQTGGTERPLLAGDDPTSRVDALKQARAYAYAAADWTIHTDTLDPEAVAAEIIRAWQTLQPKLGGTFQAGGPAATVVTPGASYSVHVGAGILGDAGRKMREAGLNGKAWVLADERAAERFGQPLLDSLGSAGYSAEIKLIASGERSKDLSVAGGIFRWLAERRAERKDAIVTLGGGVAGDLGGFVAATYLRGMPLVHVPTTLLAMTDSSIGGKTGVNLPEGKNLVGAFHQPRLVLADVETLGTLNERELVAGWAETIKHGLIRDPELFERLEAQADSLVRLEASPLVDILSRSVRVKAGVVSADEREDGLRMILNYGHTLGHALETAGNYHVLLHGEAVAIGMAGEARIANAIGLLSPEDRERQDRLIQRYGLPLQAPPLPVDRALASLSVDKKVQGKKNRWVLLEGIGRAVIRDDISPELAATVLKECIS